MIARALVLILAGPLAAGAAVEAAATFIRGDVDGDGHVDLSDSIRTLGHLFLGDPSDLGCADAADRDDNGILDITDPVGLLSYLYLGGQEPPPPFAACGPDPTSDDLSCLSATSCSRDEEPPSFLPRGCTEKACQEPAIPLEAGEPMDIVSDDSCNQCTPLRFTDNREIVRLEFELLNAEGDPAFTAGLDLSPPYPRTVEVTQTELVYLELGAVGILEGLPRIPISQDDLRLPANLTPGPYVRRIAALDFAGNKGTYDRPAVVSAPEGPIEEVAAGKPRDLAPDSTPAEIAELVEGNTEFVLALYRSIRGAKGNIFYSPYSISIALAMTHAGARGETERQMAETLRFRLPPERLHPAINALDLELARRGEGLDPADGDAFKLRVANSIWGQRGYDFLPPFLDTLGLHYGAGLRLVNFQLEPEPARLAINDWVSGETAGRIQDLLPQGSITGLTRLVLTNAIYFKASWKTPFQEGATRNAPFHTLAGGPVSASMMKLDSPLGYASGEGWQAVELQYLGGELSMVVLLPSEGKFAEFESSLDAPRLSGILGGLQETRLLFNFPRFRFEFPLPLKATLAEMGMPDAFSETAADFSGMDGRRGLFIHDVLHKALIGVDEKGTEAAAATAVIVGPTSVPPEVIVDRPFIFLIRDIPTGAVLFIGRVVDPTR